jgi:hypothetical protein
VLQRHGVRLAPGPGCLNRSLRSGAVRSLREYNEMKQAMRQSDGARLSSDASALHRSLQVFLGNCDQLLGFMSSHLDDPLAQMRLWAVQNREGFARFLDEVERLHHNVAAAALSLRDHSYRVRDKWLQAAPSDTLREEHDERVRQVFAESRTAQLVQGLRIIVQHRKLPRLRGQADWQQGGPFTSKVHLDRDDLLEWDGWSPEVRAFLEKGEEDVELDELVTEYRAAVVGFHTWFGSALRARNADALEDLERRRRELADYAAGMFGPPINDPSSEEG